MSQTLFDKIWQRNTVLEESPQHPAILYVGLHLLHDVTAPQAFSILEGRGLKVRRPDLCLASADHCAPSLKIDGEYVYRDEVAKEQISSLERHCRKHGIHFLGMDHPLQGIVHVVGPELGLSTPGKLIVCGDSHTSTHGAFGAIAFGIGSTEVAHVLASQCILQRKPKNMRIIVEGSLPAGASAKDLALSIIRKVGAKGGQGFAIEYQGEAISALSMEERMTLCNMTIECGARFGLVAPDETCFRYIEERRRTIDRQAFQDLASDNDAHWDREVVLNASELQPMMTWGTNPALSIAIGEDIPHSEGRPLAESSIAYMGWQEGQSPSQRSVDHVFIGSCTNGRLNDLRQAAAALKGQKVASHVRCLVVPGSRQVKVAAEAEGLDKIFLAAGAQWREPSCSLCNAMNGDLIPPEQVVVSTSNRSFEGRQGPGSRTILVAPKQASAIAVKGALL